ncbi:RNA exonuclease prage isoform 2-T9 [Glossina fuscipes fuscipes]
MKKEKKELKISSNCSMHRCSNKMDALMDYIRNDMDYLSWTVIGLPIAAMIYCGLLFMGHRKHGTMQRNSSKASHPITTKQHHKENHNNNLNNNQNNNNNQHQHNYHQQQQQRQQQPQPLTEQKQQQFQSLPKQEQQQQQQSPQMPLPQTHTQQQQQQQRLQQPQVQKNNSSDSGISTAAAPISNGQNANSVSNNKRKSRNSSKRQDNNPKSSGNNRNNNNNNNNNINHNHNINNNINAAITATGATVTVAPIAATTSGINANHNHQRHNTTAFVVNDWLQEEVVYCYGSRLIASNVEENIMPSSHHYKNRNNTPTDSTSCVYLNSSSSNEDLSTTYSGCSKNSKKSRKARKKRQQKRKKQQQQQRQHQQNENQHQQQQQHPPQPQSRQQNVNVSSADVEGESKEGLKPIKQFKTNCLVTTTTTTGTNLRKQCTKTAALKAVFNGAKSILNQKETLVNATNLAPSTSQSSVCSTLSAASSTSSIPSSVSSSVVSTPQHSVHSSPTASPTVTKRNTENLKKVARALTQHTLAPSKQFLKLNMNEQELIHELRRYIIDPSLLRVYGFPVESVHHEGCIEIYKCLPKHMAEEAVTKDNQRHHRHFYGRKKPNVINAHDGLVHTNTQQWSLSAPADSGRGSGDSSPRSSDSESSEIAEDDTMEPIMAFYTPDGVFQIFSEYVNTVEKQCVRCQKMFQVTDKGVYLTQDTCTYHWGKPSHVYNGISYLSIYSCCQGEESTEGCSQHPLHVWNGTVVGINGPYDNYLHTKPKVKNSNQSAKVFAMDCEMSYTGLGLEVTKVTVVGYDGTLVYEHFVQPQAEIVDYNTRFSGITAKDLNPHSNNEVKSFAQVQQDLLDLIDADTILIGHGLDNDLRVLRIVHKTIVDTSLVYGHSTGYPYRRSLKNLTKSFLKRDIQCSAEGHSSYEDSRACLELMLWKVRKDLRNWSIFQ